MTRSLWPEVAEMISHTRNPPRRVGRQRSSAYERVTAGCEPTRGT
jgi:hypothetical protein